MKPIIHLKSISDISKLIPMWKPKHPLVGIVDFGAVDEYLPDDTRISADFYTVMFKNYCKNHIRYGRNALDFQDGNLVCIAPKQVITLDNEVEERSDKMGWGLFFHPDLIRGTSLSEKMDDYTFFSYEVSEALHLSDKEKQILFDCIQKIEDELGENIDTYSQTLITSTIELFLNYCSRYYGRQFITRKNSNKDVVSQVDKWLKEYFKSENLKSKGLPSVKYLADKVNLSPSYLGDLLKKETGLTAQDHIHYHLIEQAKNLLLGTDDSVNEIAYTLGFEYPQYFSKLFKLKTGTSPVEYRKLN